MPPKRVTPLPTSDRAIERELKKIYFAPGGFVGAKKLQDRLKEKNIKTSIKFISEWLRQQDTHSLTVKPKKIKNYLRFESSGQNDKHVADLAFFRHNSNGYTGILAVVDVYSRYASIMPFKSKTADSIAKLYKKMLKDTPLEFPNQLITDSGSEFKGAFAKMLKDNNVGHQVATPGVHTTTSIVDRLIYLMKERLVREMNFRKTDAWDSLLGGFLEGYNNDKHESTSAKPIDVINNEVVPVIKTRKLKKEPLLKKGTKVRIVLAVEKGVNRPRASDRRYWGEDKYTVETCEYSPENIRFYKLKNKNNEINKHIFYHEELLVVK